MPKCDFNKVAKQLYWNLTLAWMFSYDFAPYFQNTFSQEHLWGAASGDITTLAINFIISRCIINFNNDSMFDQEKNH